MCGIVAPENGPPARRPRSSSSFPRINTMSNPSTRPAQPQSTSPAFNALKHGLFAAPHVVLPDENPDFYKRFLETFVGALNPVGAEEENLAVRIASLNWRLGRIARYEAKVEKVCAITDQIKALDRLSLYETRLSRTLERDRKALAELQAQRRGGGKGGGEKGPARAP